MLLVIWSSWRIWTNRLKDINHVSHHQSAVIRKAYLRERIEALSTRCRADDTVVLYQSLLPLVLLFSVPRYKIPPNFQNAVYVYLTRHNDPLYRTEQQFKLLASSSAVPVVQPSWNVMAQPQKPDFVLRRNGRVHLNRHGHQYIRLLATELCASAVVMLDTPRSEIVWRVLATYSIRQFPLHFPSNASPCAITFDMSVNCNWVATRWQ